MAIFSKNLLSESDEGQPIDIVATASPGTLVHLTAASASQIDEIWLYATNNDAGSADSLLSIEFGGTASSNLIAFEVPYQDGLTLMVPGLPLTGDGSTGSGVRVYGPAGLSVAGYVNRIA
jgi:hypothetical protein